LALLLLTSARAIADTGVDLFACQATPQSEFVFRAPALPTPSTDGSFEGNSLLLIEKKIAGGTETVLYTGEGYSLNMSDDMVSLFAAVKNQSIMIMEAFPAYVEGAKIYSGHVRFMGSHLPLPQEIGLKDCLRRF
jgi:hypothetical protein